MCLDIKLSRESERGVDRESQSKVTVRKETWEGCSKLAAVTASSQLSIQYKALGNQ